MNLAARAYAKVATETALPRELEATLLLSAAAKLQAVHESWEAVSYTHLDVYKRQALSRSLFALSSQDSWTA